MAKTELSVTSLLSSAWNILQKNVTSVAILLGVAVVGVVLQMILGSLGLPSFLEQILSLAISTVSTVIYVLGGLQIVRGAKKLNLPATWADPQIFLNAFLVNIIFTIAVAVGFLLLIIPGIYVALTYGMATILVADEKLGPIEAMKRSAAITQGNKMFIFVFGLVCAVLNVLGLLALGVGLLISVPVTAIAGLLLYEGLRSGAKMSV